MRNRLIESIGPDTGIGKNIFYFIKWCIIAYIIGGFGGVIGGVFSLAITAVTGFRTANPWMLFVMPISGVAIVGLYQITGEVKNRGTNMVLEAISTEQMMTKRTGFLIFMSTILTHLVGGSAGREGAALQIGGSIGTWVGRWKFLKLDPKEEKIAVMCGMAAVFSALFGTPVAAAVFSMEVISVGVMYYAAMLPCCLAAFLGRDIAQSMGVAPELFTIEEVPALNIETVQPVVLLGLLLAILSIAFVLILHGTEHKMKEYLPNPYVRILVTSVVFIALTLLVRTRVYCGSSMILIEESIEGHVEWYSFILKTVFTAIALGGGFRGGEIIPTLCVGACFGALVGVLLGFNPPLMAACGMIGLFAAVTNCPISSIFLGIELFQGQGIAFFATVVSISFTLSGYYSLYGSQKFVYAKLKNEFVNRMSNR